MNDRTEHFHSGIRQHGIRVARLVEDAGLSIILLATVVAGGELTLEMLECGQNPATGINEAPLQMKSNGGALVIDGKLFCGGSGVASELGHLRPGLHCDSPEQTLESMASGWAIAAAATLGVTGIGSNPAAAGTASTL